MNRQNKIEIFCLEPTAGFTPVMLAMQATNKVTWKCLVGGAKKWKEGPLHIKYGNNYTLTATKHTTLADSYLIQFEWDNDAQSFAEVLEAAGNIPLPPYFNRAVEANDKERYQTVYAAAEGSVAAPTAGLHFTPALFTKLAAKNITKEFVTLHVGAGTFKPVKAARMEEHEMHAEFIDVQKSFIELLRDHFIQRDQNARQNTSAKTIIAVGTTSLRTLESLYWMGAKIIAANNPIQGPCWEPINPPAHAPKIIIPSSPMLTTPARSENRPPSPAKIIGTESNKAADAVPILVKSVAPVMSRIIEISNNKYVALRSSLVALFFTLRPPLQVLYFVKSI